uniref:Soluble scavenger receptor cysteine-rich domain-containing protein SSC5D n=1 Tax=Naja naja TaxID=35670 RepID=A0A8C7DYM3_NAJNA
IHICLHSYIWAFVCGNIKKKHLLSNGPNHCAGRVEILHEKLWGTICDDDWDIDDAKVVCQYLGCGNALSAPRGSRYGPGAGPIWLDGVNCTGSETAISKCPAKTWGEHDCTHSEDAGVVCLSVCMGELIMKYEISFDSSGLCVHIRLLFEAM